MNTTGLFFKICKISLAASLIAGSMVWFFFQAAQASQTRATFYSVPSNAQATVQAGQVEGSVTPTAESQDGVTLELTTPDYRFEMDQAEGQPCQVLRVEGFEEAGQPGWPRLPVQGSLVGIPAEAQPTIDILEAEAIPIQGHYTLCPAKHPVFEQEASGETVYLGEEATRDAQAYQTNAFWPGAAAEIVSTAFIRSQRVAQVRFNPFQYNPVTGELRYYRYIRIRVRFSTAPQTDENVQATVNEGLYEPILRDSLVNYSAAKNWRTPAADETPQADAQATLGTQSFILRLNQNGVYRIRYTDLQQAGANLQGLNPHTFQLFNRGVEIPIQVSGESDGVFNPEDTILFYGQALDTKYTDTNAYFLTWGVTQGRRIASVNGTPTAGEIPLSYQDVKHVEKNSVYSSANQSGPNNDTWYWELLYVSTAPVVGTYSFDLNNIDASPNLTITFSGLLKGYSATPKQHTRVYLNGNLVDDAVWAPASVRTFAVSLPQSVLRQGSNTITVECPRDATSTEQIVMPNWFEIKYWDTFTAENNQLYFSNSRTGNQKFQVSGFTTNSLNVLDITDPGTPAQITNVQVQAQGNAYALSFSQSPSSTRRYLAYTADRLLSPLSISKYTSTNLRSPANGADYIIITHADFYTDVLPLANWRAAEGLRVRVIDVQQVYDEFYDGIFDPQAIRDFLAYAYANWQPPAPLYVLLVGDGNFDPRNYLGYGEPNYIPPYLENVDLWLLETASDNRFVTVSGSDNLPDMAIGRLPVKSRSEASALVAKIIAYEQQPIDQTWNSQVAFVADNADSAGDFTAFSNRLADEYLPAGYTAEKIHYLSTHPTVSAAKTAILNGINQGRLLVNYVGHGGKQMWASEGLLANASVNSLTNANKLPLVTSMACLTGYFHNPSSSTKNYTSLAEALVLPENKGAIASWASTGMGVATGQDLLDRGLFEAIFYEGQTRLGLATLQAKLYMNSISTYYPDLIDLYTLFGDPALDLNVLHADISVSINRLSPETVPSGQPLQYQLAYTNQGDALATHVTLNNLIPDIMSDPTVIASGSVITAQQGSRYTWNIEDLLPGQGGVITVTGIVNVKLATQVSSQATISTTILDSDAANNQAGPINTLVQPPTEVLISQTSVAREPEMVIINWQTVMDIGTMTFNVLRADTPAGEPQRLNVDPVPGYPLSDPLGLTFTYRDTSVQAGKTYYYWIEAVDTYGSSYLQLSPVTAYFLLYLPTIFR